MTEAVKELVYLSFEEFSTEGALRLSPMLKIQESKVALKAGLCLFLVNSKERSLYA